MSGLTPPAPATAPASAADEEPGLLAFLRSFPVLLVLLVWLIALSSAVALAFGLVPGAGSLAGRFVYEQVTAAQMGTRFLWGWLESLPVAALLYFVAPGVYDRFRADPAKRARFRRVNRWVALIVATGLPVLPIVKVIFANIPGFSLAVPGAVFAVWVIYRVQRHRRIPLPLCLAAVAWGALIPSALGFTGQLLHALVLIQNMPDPFELSHPAYVLIAPLWEEFGKAVGVLVVFEFVRRRFDGPVHGFVIGAMVGIGFNLIETTVYAHTTFDNAIYQIWVRQWVSGFSFGHVMFTGITGVAAGLASRRPAKPQKALLLIAGYLIASSAHFVWNYFVAQEIEPVSSSDPGTYTLFMVPINYLVVNGPFLLLVAVPVWFGLRQEWRRLGETLPVEALTGIGAVTIREAQVLLSPIRRLGQRVMAARSLGLLAYVRIGRLHAAQLDLAMERWRLAHDPGREPDDQEDRLRERILDMKYRLLKIEEATP